jgi:hypothetical protein
VPEFDVSKLRDAVLELLMTDHDYLIDDAEEAVNQSVADSPDMWNESAEAKNLANHVASEDADQVL